MNCVYVVTELTQESNKEKLLSDTFVFSSRDKAVKFLHQRYDRARLMADSGSGEFSADYSDDGWYIVVDNDGDLREGYVSEGLVVDGRALL